MYIFCSILGHLELDLQQEMEWIPNGSLMIGSELSENQHNIILWEKNGLKHGEFLLPDFEEIFQKSEIKIIKSSKDSEVLAILIKFFSFFVLR